MKQKLFTEILPIYKSKKNNPYAIRIRMRMMSTVDYSVLRCAVDTTMKRYPYFCVRLQTEGNYFIFTENHSPVVISHSTHGVDLNSAESNYHMISFSYYADWIVMDIFHGLTDATGAYEVIRTLLYYYCSSRYNEKLSADGVRIVGDEISSEEWECPVMKIADCLPSPKRYEVSKAISPTTIAGLQVEEINTAYGIIITESDFMRFNKENGASPGTMVALLLSRAIAKLFPNVDDALRIILCVNQRKALNTPLAHQSLVGGAILEYEEKMRGQFLPQQIKMYREMVTNQTNKENVLAGISSTLELTKILLAKKNDEERLDMAMYADKMANRIASANVSYVGKANFKETEKYIQEFHLWSYTTFDITVQISAVNGKFTIDFLQKFHSPIYVNAFIKELEENGITYDLQDGMLMEMPDIKLPWN